jgi:hypothetical protein
MWKLRLVILFPVGVRSKLLTPREIRANEKRMQTTQKKHKMVADY